LGRRVAPRRHRTIEEKVRIVAESRLSGASVAEVARRHAVNANQVFSWRRLADQGSAWRAHAPRQGEVAGVQVSEEQDAASAGADAVTAPREGRIEITLTDGVRIARCNKL
jgi:transposase-like protein